VTPPDRDARLERLTAWVTAQFPGQSPGIAAASADASFRRYFRVTLPDGTTRIVMDAPPDREDCGPFVAVSALLAEAGIHVPSVLAQDRAQGFLLLTDLGATTYLSALTAADAEAIVDPLYGDAIGALVRMQSAARADTLPPYDRALLERELQLFPEWFLARQRQRTLANDEAAVLAGAFERVLASNLAQPQVFVHRDYHSRNLMVSARTPGVLDFQDAVRGPITYDLVSLLRDAYIAWPEERQIDWCIRYWEAARKAALPVAADFGDFYRDFEWMGVQRQLKVVGIFARLACRDGKRQYLDDQPLVMRYLHATCRRYNDLAPLAHLLDALEGEQPATGYTF